MAELRPKDKEHQRKKILRQFFTWIQKAKIHDEFVINKQETAFWRWVREVSPDNGKKEKRWRSMSAAFLEELLEVTVFRSRFEQWLYSFLVSSEASLEDQKTKLFAEQLLLTVAARSRLEAVKADIIEKRERIDSCEDVVGGRMVARRSPDQPGAHIEARCISPACPLHSCLFYIHLLSRGCFTYTSLHSSLICSSCTSPLSISGLGFTHCKWWYQATTLSGDASDVIGHIAWSGGQRGYAKCYEISLMKWQRVVVQVEELDKRDVDRLEMGLMSGKGGWSQKTEDSTEIYAVFGSGEDLAVVETLKSRNREIRMLMEGLQGLNRDLQSLKTMKKRLKNELRTAEECRRVVGT